MCNTVRMFKNVRNIDGSKHEVTIPNGCKLEVTKIKDIQLTNKIILKNVLRVLEIQFNLILAHKL